MRSLLVLCATLSLSSGPAASLRTKPSAGLGFAPSPAALSARANPLAGASRCGLRAGGGRGPRMQFIAEDGRPAEEYIRDIFTAYDKQRKGYLTQAEYNQWCVDSKRGGRVFDNEYRWYKFLERTKDDPEKGVSYQGLVDLYNSKEMSMGAAFPLIANSVALFSCLIACILLSIPYYLPDCPQKHEVRTCRQLPFLEYPGQ